MGKLIPDSKADYKRWEKSARKKRLLTNSWERDVEDGIAQYIGSQRAINQGKPITALNLFSGIVNQLAQLYDRAPTISSDNEALEDLFNDASLFGSMAQNNKWVVGLRESFIKIDWDEDDKKPIYKTVTSDNIVIKTSQHNPHKVVQIKEARIREVSGEADEYWDVWSIEDQSNPYFAILDSSGFDVTQIFVDSFEYPYIKDGVPFLPYVMYRAEWTSDEWNWTVFEDLVEGSLDVATFWSIWGHILCDASFPQRYGINVSVPGLLTRGEGSSKVGEITTSPTSIVLFEGTAEGSPSLGQFQPGGDPKSLGEAIRDFQKTILSNVGIHPADIEQSSQESGYAISLKRSSQRREIAKLEATFRAGDLELLEKAAAIYSIFTGENLDGDIQIKYNLPTADAIEEDAQLVRELKLLELGLISKVDIMRRIDNQLSEEEAVKKLIKNTIINAGAEGRIIEALDQEEVNE